MTAIPRQVDFFISYTEADEPWAKWIAVELEKAGYFTIIQAFDFRPGTDFVHEMQVATTTVARMIAVLSPAYLVSSMGEAEWRTVFRGDPSGEFRRLIPIRVQPFTDAGLLQTRVYIDLVGQDEAEARERLLAGVASDPARPTSATFPGSPATSEPFPGSGGSTSTSETVMALQTDIRSIAASAEAQGWRTKITDTTLRVWTRSGKRLTFSIGAPAQARVDLRAFTDKLRANGLRVNRSVRVPPGYGPTLSA